MSANSLHDRILTCCPSIAIDVKNTWELYMNKPLFKDNDLITARTIDDVPAFNEALIRFLTNVTTT